MNSQYNEVTHTYRRMLEPRYWIDKIRDGGRKIMDEEEINRFNEISLKKLQARGCIYDCSAIYRQDPDIRYGICVERCDIRRFPSYVPIYGEELNAADRYTDYGQKTAMLVNEALLVLKESPDRKWYYIRNYYYEGWVEKSKIGICDDYVFWMECQNMQDFIMVTGDQLLIRYCTSKEGCGREVRCSEITGRCNNYKWISMGTKLRLVREDENYIVAMPELDEDGCIRYQLVTVPRSSDVHVGYLEYTASNVICQAFKALGNTYGWGGIDGRRDCSAYVMELFRCFGFVFPRDVSCQKYIVSRNGRNDIKEMGAAEKTKLLDALMPGTILGFEGHTMIYLGKDQGEYYVISYVKALYDQNGDHLYNSCLINSLMARRRNRRTWLESLSYYIAN